MGKFKFKVIPVDSIIFCNFVRSPLVDTNYCNKFKYHKLLNYFVYLNRFFCFFLFRDVVSVGPKPYVEDRDDYDISAKLDLEDAYDVDVASSSEDDDGSDRPTGDEWPAHHFRDPQPRPITA